MTTATARDVIAIGEKVRLMELTALRARHLALLCAKKCDEEAAREWLREANSNETEARLIKKMWQRDPAFKYGYVT